MRRVATLVARGTRPEEVFAAVANEVGRLLSVDVANVIRYESDDTVTLVASAGERIPVGSRWPLGGTTLAPIVLKTGRPARVDNYAEVTGQLAEDIREQGIRSAVATPIIVEGRVWGQMVTASSQEQPLPPDTEARLASFTELVATAIANTEARMEVGRLVDEQAALRRVATLVAEGAAPSEVFETVTREVGILCGAELARMERYESGDSVVGVAGWSRGDARDWPSARGSRSKARASPQWSARRAVPCAWTASPTLTARSRRRRTAWGSARPSAVRSSSRAASGASSPPRPRARRRSRPTPSRGSPSSPSSWRPRSRTPKRGRR